MHRLSHPPRLTAQVHFLRCSSAAPAVAGGRSHVEKSMLLAKHPESILLQKPFTPETLIAAVRQVFNSEEKP
jgi:hypothetical protein